MAFSINRLVKTEHLQAHTAAVAAAAAAAAAVAASANHGPTAASKLLMEETNNNSISMLSKNHILQWKLENNGGLQHPLNALEAERLYERASRSRSRSLSRSSSSQIDLDDDSNCHRSLQSRSRSRSSSVELEVDSPPASPIPRRHTSRPSSVNNNNHNDLLTHSRTSPKKSEMFSVSALLRKDDPHKSAGLIHHPNSDPFEALRQAYPGNYEPAMFPRPFLSPAFPFFAAFAFHQGQQQQTGLSSR